MVHPARALCVLGWLTLWLAPAVGQTASAAFQSAESQFANQDYAAAAAAFTAFVRDHGGDANAPQAAFRIAQCYGRLEQYEQAAEASATCWERYRDSRFGDTALYNKGYYYLQAKAWQPAAAAFFDYTKLGREPSYQALAWYWRAEALYNLSRYTDAVAAYQQFLARPAEVLAAENVAALVPWAYYSVAVSYQAADDHARAVTAYEAVLDRYPDHAQAAECWWRKGVCLQAGKQLDAAAAAYQTVLDRYRQSPQAPQALYGLIEIAEAKGDTARAEQLKNRLATEYPGSAELLSGARFRLARQKFEAGDYPAAEALYREALEGAEGETEAVGLIGLAEALYQQDKWAEAETALSQLLARHAAHAVADHARLRLGDVYLLREKYAEAEQLYRDCLQAGVPQRDLGRVEYNLALAVRGLGRGDEALRLFWEAVAADPKADLSATVLLVIVAETLEADPAQAERACRQFLEHHANHTKAAQARFSLAQALEAQAKLPEAAAAYRAAADQHPTDPLAERALFQLAAVYRAQGDPARAAAVETELAERFPASQLAGTMLLARGFDLFSEARYAEAVEVYEQFVRGHAGHESLPAALSNLGASYYRATALDDHFRKAAAVYRRLHDEHGEAPEAAGALYWCGRSLQEAGDHAAAIDALQLFLRDRPDEAYSIRARQRLGESLVALKRYDEAVNVYQATLALELSPDQRAAVRYELAWAMIETGDADGGYELMRQLAEEAPESDQAAHARFALAGRLFNQGDYDRAITAYQAWLQSYATHALRGRATYNLAWALEEAGRHVDAAASFAQAAELLADGVAEKQQAGYRHALNLYLADQAEAAAAALESFEQLALEPDRKADALYLRGLLAAGREDWPAAEAALRQVVEQHAQSPAAPRARLELGKVLQNQLQFEAARTIFMPLAERPGDDRPVHAEALLHLGECYLSDDLVDEALDALLRAEEAGVDGVTQPARYWAGRCYQRKGDAARAREKYQRVINEAPTSEWGRRAKDALDELAG